MTVESVASSVPVLVLGGEAIGLAIVERLLREHDTVRFLDPSPETVEAAAALGATAEVVDVTSGKALEAAFPDGCAIDLVIVIAERDATALLIGQHAKTKLGAETVIVLMHDSRNRVAFESAGMIPVCATTALASATAATLSLIVQCDPDLSPGPTAPPERIDRSQPQKPV